MEFLRDSLAGPSDAIIRNVILYFIGDGSGAAAECYCSPEDLALPLGTIGTFLRANPAIDRYALGRPLPSTGDAVPERLLYSYCTKTHDGYQQSEFMDVLNFGQSTGILGALYGNARDKQFINLFEPIGAQLAEDDFTQVTMVIEN